MHIDLEKINWSDDILPDVIAGFPAGPGPFPAVILAPGLRYDMHRPVMAQVAHHLLLQGFAVFRFNWSFYTSDAAHGQPSADLIPELQDMTSVLRLATSDRRIQQQNISVAGKSFGSIVAWRFFQQQPAVKSCVLLTPLCVADKSGGDELSLVKQNYPGAELEKRPVLMLAGNADPYCELDTLREFAGPMAARFKIVVLEGNHSLEILDEDKTVATSKLERNLALLACHIQDFLLQ
ncbi:alpha/beta hydrolase [Undibacterium sp. TC4M20W]|uniref:alpha/beta hydrolase n=1 Tax=Undibacterium sp. TC4M20W TaxID=3413052 RepID=UPI003BF3B453